MPLQHRRVHLRGEWSVERRTIADDRHGSQSSIRTQFVPYLRGDRLDIAGIESVTLRKKGGQATDGCTAC